jgi:hypothetical protein
LRRTTSRRIEETRHFARHGRLFRDNGRRSKPAALFGREEELDRPGGFVDGRLADPGGAVIRSEAGIGKTLSLASVTSSFSFGHGVRPDAVVTYRDVEGEGRSLHVGTGRVIRRH